MVTGADIVFMGTPEFAARHLRSLVDAGMDVVGVVTQPDRPKGRGRKVEPTPVKSVALEHNIPVIQPESLKKEEHSRRWIKDCNPDLLVVVAFGMILPGSVLESAREGGWNIHASLLPLYRGAAPVQWAILKGEKKTGITLIQMDESMDTGDILLQEEIDISPEETAGSLTNRLIELGVEVLLDGLKKRVSGDIPPRPQNHDKATYTRLIKAVDRPVDWTDSAINIFNKIRAFNPRPGAKSGDLKLINSRALDEKTDKRPGEVMEIVREGIKVSTGDGVLLLIELQPPSKKAMSAADYASGHKIKPGMRLN